MSNILVDTCFWFALYDKTDPKHSSAQKISETLEYNTTLIPHPVLYETLNTRFSKRKQWMSNFNNFLKRESTILVTDQKYKSKALEAVLRDSISGTRPMSLVDMTLRFMMEDVDLNVAKLITFNKGDFIDKCYSSLYIELIDG